MDVKGYGGMEVGRERGMEAWKYGGKEARTYGCQGVMR